MNFSQQFLDTVRQNAQILDVAESLGIPMSGGGPKTKLLCPFHDDTNPSMTIKENKFRCWVCNERGDAISLVSKVQGCAFPEAVKAVCAISGISLPAAVPARELSSAEKHLKELGAVLDYTSSLFQAALKADQKALSYVAGRGISNAEMDMFALGYAPRASQWLLSQHHPSFAPLLMELGLVRQGSVSESNYYSFFRDRLMFPIRDIRGRVKGFGGRLIDPTVNANKYLNSTESATFQKSDLLYGLYEATNHGRDRQDILFVVEGYTDVTGMAQAGFPACATMGTAVSRSQLKLLSRWCKHVVFVFDGDGAGQKAASETASICLGHAHAFSSIRFVSLPHESDPDTLIREHGPEALAQALKNYASIIDKLAQTYDDLLNSSGDSLHVLRQQFIETYVSPLGECPSELMRDLLASELASTIGIKWDIIDRFLANHSRKDQCSNG